MAQMFPEQLPESLRDDPQRRAEVRVYDALAAGAPRDWRVFHSVAWLSRDSAQGTRDGEADFVIVRPGRGLLIIEVKGGGIEFDGRSGQWWSTDSAGAMHAIDDPFRQAVRSKHALVGKLRETPAFRDRWVPAAHAVVFADIPRVTAPFGAHAPPEIVICADDFDRIAERIDEVFRYSEPEGDARFTEALAAEVERLLAPRRRVHAPLAVAARAADRAILTLTEDQYRVLEMLARARRVAVAGPAGSGKSLLAAEQARRLAGQGFRTLFVCFNRPLAEAMAHHLAPHEVQVHTFHELCHRMGSEAGLTDGTFVEDAPPDFFTTTLPELLFNALRERPDLRFDAIVVDEGQDFEAEWWTLLELALADPDRGILYVFHDDAQRLGDDDARLPAGLVPVQLGYNIRNTRAIHRLASRFCADARPEPSVPDGQPVEFVEVDAPDQLEPVLAEVLDRLMRKEQFRPEEVAVLSGRGQQTMALAGRERIGGRIRCSRLPVLPGVVAVDTIRRFKGLDSPVVILVEIDHLLDQPALLYVGITRARTHLVVLAAPDTIAAMLG